MEKYRHENLVLYCMTKPNGQPMYLLYDNKENFGWYIGDEWGVNEQVREACWIAYKKERERK